MGFGEVEVSAGMRSLSSAADDANPVSQDGDVAPGNGIVAAAAAGRRFPIEGTGVEMALFPKGHLAFYRDGKWIAGGLAGLPLVRLLLEGAVLAGSQPYADRHVSTRIE